MLLQTAKWVSIKQVKYLWSTVCLILPSALKREFVAVELWTIFSLNSNLLSKAVLTSCKNYHWMQIDNHIEKLSTSSYAGRKMCAIYSVLTFGDQIDYIENQVKLRNVGQVKKSNCWIPIALFLVPQCNTLQQQNHHLHSL